MSQPNPEQAQMAQEVLAGTREISGSSPVADAPAQTAPAQEVVQETAQDIAHRQAMDVVTPEFQAQMNAAETAGNTTTPVNPTEPVVGVENSGIDKMPDWKDTAGLDAMREEKRRDISGPGE